MYTIEITILIAIIGCFVALAGWLTTRDKKISSDSKWQGAIESKLDVILGIKEDVKELENKVETQGERITAVEQSAKQAHHRITEHISK